MNKLTGILLSLSLAITASAEAGVVMGGTRIIYPQGKKEVAFAVTNMDKSTPYLIQSWVENNNPQDKSQPPFIVTPPLFRLDHDQKNELRIRYTGAGLPQNRESVFWLDVKTISPKPKESSNALQINIKSKFKIFFRPDNLPGDPATAWEKLNFSRSGNVLRAINPGPYYVSFYALSVGGQKIQQPGMIGPGETREWHIDRQGAVSWSAINDFGGVTASHTQKL